MWTPYAAGLQGLGMFSIETPFIGVIAVGALSVDQPVP